MEIYQNERVTGGMYKEVLITLQPQGVFFFQTSLLGFEASFFVTFPQNGKRYPAISRQLHEETCPFAPW